ncbi:E3 SUMO-protein ligase SIZ1 [Eucalyptus grandis]|nr:E3 SUMO-protein ligase SIZ1 [Eucalyptus grandis]
MWAKKNVGKEDVAKLVDDIYRKMQVSGATDLASNGQGASDCSNVKVKGESIDPYRSDAKVRCPCGSSLEIEAMIMCEDPRCHVWQHMSCVIFPEKPGEAPENFYCELCRLSCADPYASHSSKPSHFINISTGKCDVRSS